MQDRKVLLLRHGRTKGNLEGRYIGSTDEALLLEEREYLLSRREAFWETLLQYSVDVRAFSPVYVSPLLRTRETAALLFPDQRQQAVPSFREMDFGAFEGRNYRELLSDALTKDAYQHYIDTMGEAAFPGGESKAGFQKRVIAGFSGLLQREKQERQDKQKKEEGTMGSEDIQAAPLCLLVHGGTIMSLLDAFSEPHRDYFSWQCSCLSGYLCRLTEAGSFSRIQALSV